MHRRRDANLTRISKIVAAIDLSECSKSVMEKACVVASAFISDVYLSVIKIANLVGQEGDINMQEIQEEETELSNHNKMLIDNYYSGSSLLISSKILHGDPSFKICEFKSVSADIIIIGDSGKTGLKRIFLGSTSEAISHNAPCSILIVKN